MKFKLNKKIAVWCALVLLVVFFSFRFLFINSDACQISIRTLIEDEVAHEYLGNEIETGFLITGSVQQMGERSVGRFIIPVKGDKNSGQAEVEAKKRDGVWYVNRLDLILKSGEKIKLR